MEKREGEYVRISDMIKRDRLVEKNNLMNRVNVEEMDLSKRCNHCGGKSVRRLENGKYIILKCTRCQEFEICDREA